MIIPVRCFTCNLIIGSKYQVYLELVDKIEKKLITEDIDQKLTAAENAFKILQLDRYCCRRHLLSHTDLVDII